MPVLDDRQSDMRVDGMKFYSGASLSVSKHYSLDKADANDWHSKEALW